MTAANFLSNRKTTLAFSLILLLSAAGVLFFAGLGRLPLVEPDEGRNAEVGREMLVSGDWVTPHYDDMVYLDKPAVFFWMVAGSMKALGVSEFAARLPSALMALGTVLLVWFLARRMFGESAGVYAGIVFAVSPLALVLAREVIFDMTLTFLVTVAMVAFWLAEENDFRGFRFHALMFAAMGMAVITKGFVGILIPVVACLIYEAARGHWREWLRLRWGWGMLIFLGVALPWFIAVSLRHPDFPRYAFWNESLQRFTTAAAHRGGGIFYFLAVFLGGFFPWSLFLLLAGWNRLRRWRELTRESGRRALFLLSWAGWVLVFFSFSHSKLPTYFLPAIVPVSILMGAAWQSVAGGEQSRPPDWLTAGFALVLGIGVLVAAASHSWLYTYYHGRFGRKVPPDILGFIQPSLLYTGIIMAALGFLGRRLARQFRGRAEAIATFALAAIVVPAVALRWYQPLQALAEFDSSRRLAATIRTSPQGGDPIIGYYCFRTSLPFYLRRPVALLSIEWGELTSNYEVAHQKLARRPSAGGAACRLLITPAEFLRITRSNSQPVLVITPNTLVESLWHAAGQIDPMWNEFDFSVWEVPPAAGRKTNVPVHVVPLFQP